MGFLKINLSFSLRLNISIGPSSSSLTLLSSAIWYQIQWTLKILGLECLTCSFRISIWFLLYSFNFFAKTSCLFIHYQYIFLYNLEYRYQSYFKTLASNSNICVIVWPVSITFSLLKWVRVSCVWIHLVISDCILDIANDVLGRPGILLYSTKVYWFFVVAILAGTSPELQTFSSVMSRDGNLCSVVFSLHYACALHRSAQDTDKVSIKNFELFLCDSFLSMFSPLFSSCSGSSSQEEYRFLLSFRCRV